MGVTGGTHGPRTDTGDARKVAAASEWADTDHGKEEHILRHIQGDSGHGGAVTIDHKADQVSRSMSFLMENVGLKVPASESGD